MAKKSQINRDNKRHALIAKYAEKRAELRKILKDPNASMDDKLEAQAGFAKLPRNSCSTRKNNRCAVSGRSKAYYNKFGISRIALRELALRGQLPRRAQEQLVEHASSEANERHSMKPEIHPDYHQVIFVDSATGNEWTSRSTVTSKETREVDGVEVPVVRLEISSVSHPFWTGKMRELDADGKIDRFRKRYGGGKK